MFDKCRTRSPRFSYSMTLHNLFALYADQLCVMFTIQAVGVLGTATAGAIGLGVALQASVLASDLMLHPPAYPWTHNGTFSSFDHARLDFNHYLDRTIWLVWLNYDLHSLNVFMNNKLDSPVSYFFHKLLFSRGYRQSFYNTINQHKCSQWLGSISIYQMNVSLYKIQRINKH